MELSRRVSGATIANRIILFSVAFLAFEPMAHAQQGLPMNNWIGNINGNNGIITQGQIGNNTINFGKQPRNLDAPQMQGLKNAILTELPRDKAFSIGTVMGDQEAISLAMQVHSFMKSQGFQVGDGVFQGVFSGPVVGYVRNDKPDGGVEIIIGANPH